MTIGVKITENFAQRMAATIRRVDSMPLSSGDGRIPVRLEDKPVYAGGMPIRIGQFSGAWSNDPGETGSANVKPVTLYTLDPNPEHPNDYYPELDDNGDPIVAVALNLFSYIPTPPSSGQMMWCAVVPLASVSGEYESGGFTTNTEGDVVPITKSYDTLWLLLAAEC